MADIQEFPPITDAFNIQADTSGIRIFIQPFNQVTKIDIGHITQGNEFVKSHAAGIGTGIDCDQQCAALSEQRCFAIQGKEWCKGGIHFI